MQTNHGKWIKGLLLGLLAALALQHPSRANEDGSLGERLNVRGFGTLGWARSDRDAAEFVRDLSQPRGLTSRWSSEVDSLLGLQANLKLNEQTEGVLQMISRYRYDGSYRPEISWAFLRHDFSPDFQMRLGRLGTEFYMLADSRLIGYANVTVRPPPDFYGPLVFSYFDGIDASAGFSLGDGLLRAKLFYGRSPESSPFYDDITWNLASARLSGGHLDYFTGPWQIRLAHAEVKFPGKDSPLTELANRFIDANPLLGGLQAPIPLGYGNPLTGRVEVTTLVPELSTSNTKAHFDSIGATYDKGPLQITGMLGRIRYETAAYEDSRAAFVIVAYRLDRVTPYLGYSIAKSADSTISTQLPGLTDFAKELTGATHLDQRTLTLGLRWDFHANWAMKLQLDVIRGHADSVFGFRGHDTRWDGRKNVLSTTLDFAF